jgi:hypothetical protein
MKLSDIISFEIYEAATVVPLNNDAIKDMLTVQTYAIQNEILSDFANREPGTTQTWPLISAARLKKIWNDHARTGIIRDEKGLDAIADLVVKNTIRLDINTQLLGHSQSDSKELFAEYFGEDANLDGLAEEFSEYAVDERGQWRLSDGGVDQLYKITTQLVSAISPEQKLMLIDMAFNVVHQRSDLAAMFVEGGTKTLNALSRN